MEMATFLSSLDSMTSCITRSMELPWDHFLDHPLPIFLLATITLNFFKLISIQRCIAAIGMTLSWYLATRMSAIFSDISVSTRFTFLFSLLLKNNLTWLSLSWTCWLKKIPFQVHYFHLPQENPHSPINIQ